MITVKTNSNIIKPSKNNKNDNINEFFQKHKMPSTFYKLNDPDKSSFKGYSGK